MEGTKGRFAVGSFQGWKKLAGSVSLPFPSFGLSTNCQGPPREENGGMRRAILGKTSKLHFQRLKLFPYDVAREKDPWLTGSMSILARSSTGARCPSVRTNSSIVFRRQQITFRHVCVSLSADSLRGVPPPSLVAPFHRSRRAYPRFLSRERLWSSRRSFHFYAFS